MHQIETEPTIAGARRSDRHSGRKSFALRRMIACRSGSSAVEFALVVIPFLGMLFWTINAALVFFAQQALQTATEQAARLVMTGQAQTSGLTVAQFKQAVCAGASPLFNCANLYVNIQTFASFSSATMDNPNQGGTFTGTGMSYSLGNSGDIEILQVFYQWPVFTTLMGSLADLGGNMKMLVATAAFRNEPY